MKNLQRVFLSVLISISAVSCAGPNATMGTAVGGLVGAGVGAIAGHQSGRALEGAAIGAGAGAIGGGLIGHSQDQRNAEAERRYQRQPQYNDGYDRRYHSYERDRGYYRY